LADSWGRLPLPTPKQKKRKTLGLRRTRRR
jgi:hypothetical protein